MESWYKTIEKINIDLIGKPFLSITISLLILIIFVFFKIFFLEHVGNFSQPIFTLSNYEYSENNFKDGSSYIYASSRGIKYYFYNCKSNIKESNKIYFENELKAQEAGYTLSKSCQ